MSAPRGREFNDDSLKLQAELMKMAMERHAARAMHDAQARRSRTGEALERLKAEAAPQPPTEFATELANYMLDSWQRALLTMDALRKRGDIFIAHEDAGAPPVLIYDYEVVVDGRDLPRPCNYMLLEIKPPEGIEVFAWKRPYVIIDPRAGHGPGIGGFKTDSQVGVALRDGHPVYFVAFRPIPEPDQTIADVTHAEAAFLREVRARHPDSPKPVVVGNCQGGWATAILAAMNPDLTGPIVLNGAPMSYWSGKLGQDPMRYTGGIAGGVLPALIASDLGGGLFDGAHLVLNFESLNPGRTWFRKYYDLYRGVDTGEARFLEFEKWWGGFYLMNEAEIRWIVENLFVGNRLGRNEARLETGRPIDPKAIRAPIIVFASHGDNITPPGQALNWIVDTYANEREIEIRGQRILYMVHDEVGHLGIFVSSSVAKREHTQMASTLKTIEALPPGLYEMRIEDQQGEGHEKTFAVSFARRQFEDLLTETGGRREERAFAAVARLSENLAEAYDTTVRPMVRASVTPRAAVLARQLHPLRAQRRVFATRNPAMGTVAGLASHVRENRVAAGEDNPFVMAERLWADAVEAGWNLWRDSSAAMAEATFLALYAHPLAQWYGAPRADARIHKSEAELDTLPEMMMALERTGQGGLGEAVVRMLVLLADTRRDVRRDRLQRSSELLTTRPPFDALDPATRTEMIHTQTLIVRADPDAARAALPVLLPTPGMRRAALDMVRYVVGDPAEMEQATLDLLTRLEAELEEAATMTEAAQ
ncbi:DUF3141 domain-containing protein [Pontivivens ytuae]|uniref:DUF3141 domain-containing protein n=1 Tax=Pontivivens ytuae TaxID=2789856 RepID=A0A7S9LUI9_9RHOB|nr:DUF3141 domain-containing protein [Pontivivens ytuae]QPH55499.1 DUF3141 domain-containing protein [Pontivivens ytuae]